MCTKSTSTRGVVPRRDVSLAPNGVVTPGARASMNEGRCASNGVPARVALPASRLRDAGEAVRALFAVDVGGLARGDRVGAWRRDPRVDPAGRLRERHVVADEVWVLELLEELGTGSAV